MNYALLIFAFLLCGIGLTLGFVFFEPIGFVLDGLGFMLFLYVIATRNKEERYTAEDVYRSREHDREIERRLMYIDDRKDIWVCPDCKKVNLNEEKVCHYCKRIKPIPKTKQE